MVRRGTLRPECFGGGVVCVAVFVREEERERSKGSGAGLLCLEIVFEEKLLAIVPC